MQGKASYSGKENCNLKILPGFKLATFSMQNKYPNHCIIAALLLNRRIKPIRAEQDRKKEWLLEKYMCSHIRALDVFV